MDQDIDQGAIWRSSRLGPLPVDRLAIPHAARALAQLRRQLGEAADWTRLARALLARTAQDGACSGVAGYGGSELLRDADGRYVGSCWRETYRRRREGADK